jgi:hypothetical protein
MYDGLRPKWLTNFSARANPSEDNISGVKHLSPVYDTSMSLKFTFVGNEIISKKHDLTKQGGDCKSTGSQSFCTGVLRELEPLSIIQAAD